MSVIGTYARLDAADLAALRSNPQWWQALSENKVASAEVIDLDKAWHAIAWLLSRVPTPAPEAHADGAEFHIVRSPAAVLSGEGGTNEPLLRAPYGTAKSLNVEQVATLNRWLINVSPDLLRRVFDGTAMDEADVYPQIWTEDPQALEEYLLPNFELLQGFIARAAEAKQPVLVYFT